MKNWHFQIVTLSSTKYRNTSCRNIRYELILVDSSIPSITFVSLENIRSGWKWRAICEYLITFWQYSWKTSMLLFDWFRIICIKSMYLSFLSLINSETFLVTIFCDSVYHIVLIVSFAFFLPAPNLSAMKRKTGLVG